MSSNSEELATWTAAVQGDEVVQWVEEIDKRGKRQWTVKRSKVPQQAKEDTAPVPSVVDSPHPLPLPATDNATLANATDDDASPSTEELPPTAQPVEKLPPPEESRSESAGDLQPAAEEWGRVETLLIRARDLHRESLRAEEEAFEALDLFLGAYGEEGKQLAAVYPRLVADEREAQAALAGFKAKRTEGRRAAAALAEAEQRLQEHEAQKRRQTIELMEEMRRARITAAKAENRQVPCCYVCGLQGVMRGRECPRREWHNHSKR